MNLPNPFQKILSKSPIETNDQVLTGAIGGVIPRISPTNVTSMFGSIPSNTGTRGVTSPVAARPSGAPMLKSANYHTQIPGIGRLLGMDTVDFARGTTDVHRAAVSDVEHVSPSVGVHPSVTRKVRRGNGSV